MSIVIDKSFLQQINKLVLVQLWFIDESLNQNVKAPPHSIPAVQLNSNNCMYCKQWKAVQGRLPKHHVQLTYTNLTAPVPAGGAIHETVIDPLSLELLWVTALCNGIIALHIMAFIL